MKPKRHVIEFSGELIQRGFWLYVWEIRPPNRRKPLYYVGRTGDSATPNAQSPFNRMGQHLGFSVAAQLRRNLDKKYSLSPEKCSFRLIAYGPILEEEPKESFRERRDVIAALEQALAEAMKDSGYDVMNKVNNRMPLNRRWFKRVRAAFSKEFPRLKGAATNQGRAE